MFHPEFRYLLEEDKVKATTPIGGYFVAGSAVIIMNFITFCATIYGLYEGLSLLINALRVALGPYLYYILENRIWIGFVFFESIKDLSKLLCTCVIAYKIFTSIGIIGDQERLKDEE